jgi:aldehyde dehydrogenase
MRVFQEEIFGPVVSVTKFGYDDAIAIANDTLYGLGAGVWTRDTNTAYRSGAPSRPAASGPTAITPIRRTRHSAATSSRASAARTHKMMLDHYQQTKNLLVSYSPNKLGFF